MCSKRDGETAILSISEIIRPGWSICYETHLYNRVFIRAWALYHGPQASPADLAPILAVGALKFVFWQEIDQDVLGRGGGKVRLISELLCRPDFHPLRFTTKVEQMSSVIDFDEKCFYATLPDGTHTKGSCANAEFLLASNMVPQLAIKLYLIDWARAQGYDGAFFSPNSLQVVPYSLKSTGTAWRSSFDEVINLDSDGWITEIVLPEREFSVQRVSRSLPRWRNNITPAVSRAKMPIYQLPSENIARVMDITCLGRPDLLPSIAMPPWNIEAFASALFFSGSGRHDRHGFADGIDLGYHELLDRLASGGIISLRYETRARGSTQTGEDILEPKYDDIIKDARTVFNYLCERSETRSLPKILIGHSQGGLVALELATGTDTVAGIVLMATAGRPIDEVLAEQLVTYAQELHLSPETQSYQLEQHREFFRAVREVDEWTPENVSPKIYAERRLRLFYRQLLARNPLQLARRLRCPVLIVQGSQDLQISVRDAELLYKAARFAGVPCQLSIFPGLDHLFKRTGHQPSIAAYFDRRRRVAANVITVVQRWILKVAASP